jgi:hypothetical protein
MKRLSHMMAAGAIFGSMACWAVPQALAADNPPSQRTEDRAQQAPLTLPPGFQQKDLNEGRDIQSELATVTNDALTKDHFDNFLNNLVDQDRNRLKNDKKPDVADLNGKINVIQKFWHDKYGHDFDIKGSKDIYSGVVAIVTGEVTDSAQAVMNWPMDPKTGQPMKKSEDAVAASAHETGKVFGGEVKLDKGRNVAAVRFAASHGLPSVTASMIHELPDQWRFDIPNSRTGDQIYNDLLNHLNFIAIHSSHWPSDEADAYRMVTHRVLLALYGVDAKMQSGGDRVRD